MGDMGKGGRCRIGFYLVAAVFYICWLRVFSTSRQNSHNSYIYMLHDYTKKKCVLNVPVFIYFGCVSIYLFLIADYGYNIYGYSICKHFMVRTQYKKIFKMQNKKYCLEYTTTNVYINYNLYNT